MEKILNTTTDCYGEKIPTAAVIQKNGMLYIWEVNCLSSQNYNLGNCRCVNHDAATERPISTAEVIQRFGVRSLDGFEKPGREQIIFDAFFNFFDYSNKQTVLIGKIIVYSGL